MVSRTEIIGDYVEFIYCACGCGFTRPLKDKWGKKIKYIKGHMPKGENHYRYQKENMTYKTIHKKMNKVYPKKEFCEKCGLVPSVHLANITGIYNLELKNWKRLCHVCHYNFDKITIRGWVTKKKKGFLPKRDKNGRFFS